MGMVKKLAEKQGDFMNDLQTLLKNANETHGFFDGFIKKIIADRQELQVETFYIKSIHFTDKGDYDVHVMMQGEIKLSGFDSTINP